MVRRRVLFKLAGLTAAGLMTGHAAAQGVKQRTGRIVLVALGDSLTAGYQLAQADAFPVRLQAALRARGHDVEVINAGVSGDTAGGGLERLDWAVPDHADGVILELGANDALRGLDPRQTRAALERIITRLKAKGVEVLLAGMAAPRNLGEAYVKAFDAIYPELAAEHGLIRYPFFLDGVAFDPALNLSDGLHPNARGVGRIVEGILPSVEQLIGRIKARRTAAGKG